MTTRHITVSAGRGIVTELELMRGEFGLSRQYILRCYRSVGCVMDVPDKAWVPWSGFRYRNREVSVLLPLEGQSQAKA